MRIIAGRAKGRKLAAPKGRNTRPTPDRVKEALFSILGDEIQDVHVLDLFAGSGALGLEALSRGARSATLIDLSRDAIDLIRANASWASPDEVGIQRLKLPEQMAHIESPPEGFGLVFADPPYARRLLVPTLSALAEKVLLRDDAQVVVEFETKAGFESPSPWKESDRRTWGEVSFAWLTRVPDGPSLP